MHRFACQWQWINQREYAANHAVMGLLVAGPCMDRELWKLAATWNEPAPIPMHTITRR